MLHSLKICCFCCVSKCFSYFSFLKFPECKVTTYCKDLDLIRIITVNNVVIIRQRSVLMSHEPDSLQSSLHVAALFGRAAETGSEPTGSPTL